ncbi:unnamed protein product, partial [Rotaria sp. Silwood2]
KRRQDRDLLAIRRILAHFSLLCTLGLPRIIFLGISLIIDGIPHPLVYRVLWVGVEISIATLCVSMLVMTPQLKQIVMRRAQQTRVMTIENGVPMQSAQ